MDGIYFCKNCGKKIEHDGAFCQYCGAKLREDNTENLTDEADDMVAADDISENVFAEGNSVTNMSDGYGSVEPNSTDLDDKNKKSKKQKIFEIICEAAGTVFILAVILILYTQWRDERNINTTIYNAAVKEIALHTKNHKIEKYDKDFIKEGQWDWHDFGLGELRYGKYTVTIPVEWDAPLGHMNQDVTVYVYYYTSHDNNIPESGLIAPDHVYAECLNKEMYDTFEEMDNLFDSLNPDNNGEGSDAQRRHDPIFIFFDEDEAAEFLSKDKESGKNSDSAQNNNVENSFETSELDKTKGTILSSGDEVLISYSGSLIYNGEEIVLGFENGTTSYDERVIIGSSSIAKEISDALTGCTVGETITVYMSYPEDSTTTVIINDETCPVAGKPVKYEIEIKGIYGKSHTDEREQNMRDSILSLIEGYYSYLKSEDADYPLIVPADGELKLAIKALGSYVQDYSNLNVYVGEGAKEGEYIALATCNLHLYETDTDCPVMEYFYIRNDEGTAMPYIDGYFGNLYSSGIEQDGVQFLWEFDIFDRLKNGETPDEIFATISGDSEADAISRYLLKKSGIVDTAMYDVAYVTPDDENIENLYDIFYKYNCVIGKYRDG